MRLNPQTGSFSATTENGNEVVSLLGALVIAGLENPNRMGGVDAGLFKLAELWDKAKG